MPVYTHWDTWDARPLCSHRPGARMTTTFGRPRGVTDAEILDALRAFYVRHGRSPLAREMRGMNHGVPSRCLLKTRFGSPARAFGLAGIPTRRKGGQTVHGRRQCAVVPIDPERAEAVTRAKRDYWSQVFQGKHGLTTWVHPYARRSA